MAIIDKPTDYFNTKLYTGNGTSNQAITGVGFQPDFTWIKIRSSAHQHTLIDSVRGVNKGLLSNSNAAEDTNDQYGWLSSFDSDGFTTQDGSATDHWNVNKTNETYASWNWKAGGSASNNTNGTTTTSVSVNTTAGFSIGTYTGTSSVATMGHGLGAVPGMIIVKNLSSGTRKWAVWHQDLTSASKYLSLNETSAELNDTATWNNTLPTNLVFSSAGSGEVNQGSQNFVFYAFTQKQNYSKFGSYTGNGNANGTFVYTGQKSAFIMLKNTTRAASWLMFDNKRLGYNVDNNEVVANTSAAEETYDELDILSNGFKMRANGTSTNLNGDKYIYMAFAENPFVSSTAIPACAR